MATDDLSKTLAAALGRIPSGLFIVTAVHAERESGMLASWVQQCSFRPPMLSFAVQPGRGFATLLETGTPVAVHVLEEGQKKLVAHFGKGFDPGDDAFAGLNVTREPNQAPRLAEALAVLTGTIVDRHAAGDHVLFFAEITAGELHGDGKPSVHVRKSGLHY